MKMLHKCGVTHVVWVIWPGRGFHGDVHFQILLEDMLMPGKKVKFSNSKYYFTSMPVLSSFVSEFYF